MARLPWIRRLIVTGFDILFVILGLYISFFLRFDGHLPPNEVANLFRWTPVLAALRILFFYVFGLYHGVWRYASLNDLLNVAKAVLAGTIAFVLIVVFSLDGLVGFPRSIFIVEALLSLFLIGGLRFSLRMYRGIFPKAKGYGSKRILIVGAGDAGHMILREIKNNAVLAYEVKGFMDDARSKQSMNILGVPVLGTRLDIVRVAEAMEIDEIIIAIPSATRQHLRPIVEECEKTKAKIKTVPALGDLINGRVSINQVREVQIEDLLGREVVEIDTTNIRKYIVGKRVLVTGAGGSIGSEICRQVLKFNPRSLILLGRGEFSIYQINHELASLKRDTQLIQVIGDIINRRKIEGVFRKFRPQIVFHAGADKHVPLLELNPDEAVMNNVIGTKNVIEVAEQEGVEKVVCVSTDKAADPVSVMGCSKRIAELIIQNRAHASTVTMGVRFGNVLGSRGSVIPLFRRQIAAGGPVTVTHPDMVRYFMTIPEAAQLVLQAGAIGACGDIYLLDMGSPVKIADLARQMIRLSGFEPDEDIPVEFTGLRPGEKLVESLTGKGETLQRTTHPKIFRLSMEDGHRPQYRESDIEELKACALAMDDEQIALKLKDIVPNYDPGGRPGKKPVASSGEDIGEYETGHPPLYLQ